MEWEGQEESSNVDDRRGMGTKIGIAGGGVAILILLAGWMLGVDLSPLAEIVGGGGAPQAEHAPRAADPQEEKMAKFSKVIFRSTEKVWSEQFQRLGKKYVDPTLVLYNDRVNSGCGNADSSVGPFYCGADQHVYLDLSFFHDMETKLNASGEFARAYVIAHEVGHHVQHLLGYSARAEEFVRAGRQTQNQASVRLELQADYFAGVWGHHAKDTFKLNEADIKTAIHAAYEIGDDRLQKKARGQVFPEKFTHGTSKQRMHWFMEGYKSGDVNEAARLFTVDYKGL
jgi:predicted metalloprotease